MSMIHKLRRAATMHPSGISLLDSIKHDEIQDDEDGEDEDNKEDNDDNEDNEDNDSDEYFISNSKHMCKCCKRSLISKQALENHMTKCFMIKVDNLTKQVELLKEVLDDARFTHAQQIEELEKSHEHTIQFMIKYVEASDKKLMKLYQSSFEYMKVIATSDYIDHDGNVKDDTKRNHERMLSAIFN